MEPSGGSGHTPETRVFLAVLAPLALLGGGTAHSVAAAKPNIVLILTDDQALHELADMPQTRALLAGRGTTFSNA
jgi:hypothetical protein